GDGVDQPVLIPPQRGSERAGREASPLFFPFRLLPPEGGRPAAAGPALIRERRRTSNEASAGTGHGTRAPAHSQAACPFSNVSPWESVIASASRRSISCAHSRSSPSWVVTWCP